MRSANLRAPKQLKPVNGERERPRQLETQGAHTVDMLKLYIPPGEPPTPEPEPPPVPPDPHPDPDPRPRREPDPDIPPPEEPFPNPDEEEPPKYV